jgi:hypothetical protein
MQFCVEYHIRPFPARAGFWRGIKINRVNRPATPYIRPAAHKRSDRPMRPLRQLGPRLRGRNAKAIRVAAISTDQLVSCLKCGEPMRLSDAQTFVCRQCGRAVDVEGILKSLDAGE